ncbi:hypothetical protein CKY28_11970 [Sphingomonas lenta]|uniref:Peptidase S1 domain-containing protein n=1 Tax=Sphingomonas lenta TaxID=1141887 RepID=A0A2A2SGM1_9SPHN|nr:hypothetical protein CKY28_11970 [Sphingomonas lenta]
MQTPLDALAQDAGEYAARYGVPLDEALRRLRAQEESVAATDAIARRFADRLTGIAIEHMPDYRIVVLLKGDAPVPEERLFVGGMAVPVLYRTGAAATRGEVVAAIERHQPALRANLPHAPSLGLNQRTGEMVVTVDQDDVELYGHDALLTDLTLNIGVPVRLRSVDRVANLSVEGGARVVGVSNTDGRRYACTTGFVVTDGARAGVVTAAHCPDALSYVDQDRRELPLTFIDQWGWGYQDVQLHLAAEPLRPYFFADTPKTRSRPVTGSRGRHSMRAGDFVCHRGERTGYSCAEVELTDFAPSGDLCGGDCTPTWVTVAGPVCRSGDSGGPVFVGTTALGLVKGASYAADGGCNFFYYMPIDFLPRGWTVLREGVTPLPVPPSPRP